MSRLPRVPIAIATAATVLAASLVVLTFSDSAGAAPNTPSFRLVSTVDDSPSYRSAISTDGEQIAYQTDSSTGRSVIKVRDYYGGDAVELPNAETSATTPSMSGDGSLVSFLGDTPGAHPNAPQDLQLYVVNRKDAENPTVKQVTAVPGDLPYQRMVRCTINGHDNSDDADCEPKLSRDGRTLVAPVVQTIDDAGVELSVDGESLHTDRGLEPLIDLGAFYSSAEATLTVKNTSSRPIVYPDTGPTIEGDAGFVASGTCAATLAVGASCTVTVKYTSGGDCTVESDATLRLPATSANGQTAIKLTAGGECPRLAAFPPIADAAAADACTGPSQYRWDLPIADEPAKSEGRPHPYFALGDVPAGELGISAVTLQNSMAEPKFPTLTSTGCQLKFVLPAAADARACHPGQAIPANSSCVAYVEYNVAQVAPFLGSFHVGDTVYRLSGHASRRVIAAWRDASATGTFGPAQVVSVTGPDGPPMDGIGPTVSANGRWIGYASATALGRPVTNPNSGEEDTQIYLHDTDANGDGSHRAGQTVLVSQQVDGSLPLRAHQASVSDDGSRIAFTGFEPPSPPIDQAAPGTRPGAVRTPPNPDRRMQVYVRDRVKQRTVLASGESDGTGGDAFSDGPQLSGDGGTVVYRSSASNLGVGELAGIRILARDLTADLAGGRSSNELITVRPDGPGSSAADRFPSVNQDGTSLAFVSTDEFDTADRDSTSDVYTAIRQGHVSIDPPTLAFGKLPVRTASGPKPITIHNDGQTAVRFDEPEFSLGRTEYKLVGDQCTDQVIRPGESCVYTIEFTPRYVGDRNGRFFTENKSGASVDSIQYELTGAGTSDAKTTGETSHVSTGDGVHSDPSISDNGQFVAYKTTDVTPEATTEQINIKDQASKQITRLASHDQVGPTTISADGTRVGYNAVDGGHEQVTVADKAGTHPVSGTETDLRYERPAECYRRQAGDGDRQCRPALSGDGKTIAYPARLDPEASWLTLTVSRPNVDPVQITNVIDFGTSGAAQTLTIKTDREIRFTAPPTPDPGAGFQVVNGSTCTGVLAAGASCTAQITHNACGGKNVGILRLPGATPDGQTAISLMSDFSCVKIASNGVNARPAGCTPIPDAPYMPYEQGGSKTNAGNSLASDTAQVGSVNYMAIRVGAESLDQNLELDSDCDFQLVGTTAPDPDRPKPCVDGGTLPALTECTAIIGIRPGAPDVSAATLQVSSRSSMSYNRFTSSGFQDVVLTRADTAGDATFAGPPQIASRNDAGQAIDGTEPSLSANGRYLAFASSAIIGRAAGFTDQVYRRDLVAGKTMLVSQLPDGEVASKDTFAPSLSAAGDKLAFVTDGNQPSTLAAKNKKQQPTARDQYAARQETAARNKAALPLYYPSEVWARDISTGKTVLVSGTAAKPDTEGEGWSFDPSMSDDGSTVGYTSGSDDLVTAAGNGRDAVYVRFLDPDFAGAGMADRFNERISLTADGAVPEDDGDSEAASLSSDGAFTAFHSESELVSTDTDDDKDVYVRRRPAQLVVEPAAVDYGPVKVGTTAQARRMTVRNVGMGPAAAGPGTTAAPFAQGNNLCKTTLHRGQSCVVDATFKPVAPGRADGLLNVPSVQGYLPGPAVCVTLTGTGTAAPPVAGFSAVPGKLVFGGTGLGKTGTPLKVVLRNTGQVPLSVKPTLTSAGGDFGANLTACASLMPGAQCAFPVTFAPRKTGQRTGSITFAPSSQSPGVKGPAPLTVSLVGTGNPGPRVASMTVAPRTLVFGPQILLSNSAPRSIVVTNTGNVPLNVTGVSVNADFVAVSKCRGIQPGKTCDIAVQFVPRALGTRFGAVQVAATALAGVAAPFPVSVGLRGTTATPLLQVEPPVVQPGQIVLATGTNFPPGRPVVLGWQTGIGTQPIVADAKGHFQTAVLVFKRDVLGQRLLTGTLPGLPAPVLSPPVLVQPLSPQPPNFVLRW